MGINADTYVNNSRTNFYEYFSYIFCSTLELNFDMIFDHHDSVQDITSKQCQTKS